MPIMRSWLFLFVSNGIISVYSQFGASDCDSYMCPTPDCSSAVSETYTCNEENYGGAACVEYADKCSACTRACGEATQFFSASVIYTLMQCGLGACPTPAPIVPGTPTSPPSPAPTFTCEQYDCISSTGCDAEPAEAYKCDGGGQLQGYDCTDHANQCAACCEAETMSSTFLGGLFDQQDMFDRYCTVGLCATPAPIVPGTPTSPPSPAPTLVCDAYDCSASAVCDGQPIENYMCDGSGGQFQLQGYGCTDHTSQCAACCEAQTMSANYLSGFLTQDQMFSGYCGAGVCPSADPSASPTGEPTTGQPSTSPTLRPTRSPLVPGQTHAPSPNPTTADPTTADPTTASPTAVNPTTAIPTTADPTTASPVSSPRTPTVGDGNAATMPGLAQTLMVWVLLQVFIF